MNANRDTAELAECSQKAVSGEINILYLISLVLSYAIVRIPL